jgi:hypothetical protein
MTLTAALRVMISPLPLMKAELAMEAPKGDVSLTVAPKVIVTPAPALTFRLVLAHSPDYPSG